MRYTRERNASFGVPLAGGAEKLSSGNSKFPRGGSSSTGKLKIFETKKEKNKRRMIVGDSDSDDYPVYSHRQRAVTGCDAVEVVGNCSGARKLQFEGSIKSGKKIRFSPETVRQRDAVKYRHDHSIHMSSVSPGTQRKRNYEALQNDIDDSDDDDVLLKKIKSESMKYTNRKRLEVNVERMRLDSVRSGVGKSLIRVSRLPGLRQGASANEGSETFGRMSIQGQSEGLESYEAEADDCMEQFNDKRWLSQNISSSSNQNYSVSSDGRSLRVQGRGGVLRLLPNNKKLNDNSVPYHAKGEPDKRRKSSGCSLDTSKNILSDSRKFNKKSSSSSLDDELRKASQSPDGANQHDRQNSLSDGRKILKRQSYPFTRGKVEKSPDSPNSADHIASKCLSLYKDKKHLKKQESPIKEEKIKDLLHSGGIRSLSNQRDIRGERIAMKNSVSSALDSARECPEHSGLTVAGAEGRKSLRNSGCSSKKKSYVGPKDKGLKLKKDYNGTSLQKSLLKTDKGSQFRGKEAGNFILKSPASCENVPSSDKLSRRTEKQKLRDHIKSMLLNAGWTIDMRPRRGRNYVDAVYVSPEGTGYWSITKAYSVFQEQCNKNDEIENDEEKELHGHLFKGSSTTGANCDATSQFSAIPSEMLKMLQRNVVKKRRRVEEMEQDNRKCVNSSKYAKNKKVSVIKKRINENGMTGSGRKKNKNGRGCTLLVRGSNIEADSEDDGYVPYAGKRSILSWMIDSGTVPANGKVKYMNKRHTRKLLDGLISRDGIHCSCCSKLLTVSKFEIHAGSKLNQPYANIFVEESRASLLQCQLDAWDKQKESERCGFQWVEVTEDDPNDDTCAICGDGGDLICCDSCPSTFHLSCLGIQMLPPGDWNCMNCLCRFCGEVHGMSHEEDCTSQSMLLLSCEQCEGKYHETCVPETDVAPVGTNNSRISLCGQDCRRLYKHLQKLLGIKNDLEGGFSWTLVRRFDDEHLRSCSNLAQRAECNSKVAVALAVMNECFLPIIDRRSGINLIHNVLYNRGSNFHRLCYSGFYTFVLERGDEIVSAASIRIRGTKVAEMPFIGTRDKYRRQGMCRRLLTVIEETLRSFKIERLVIPAISDLMHTWTVVFGFKPLDDTDRQEIKSMNMLVFPDTGLLQKMLQVQECITTTEGWRHIEEDSSMTNNAPEPKTSNDIISCSVDVRDDYVVERCSSLSPKNDVDEDLELACRPPSDVPSDAPARTKTEAFRSKSLESNSDGTISCDHTVGSQHKRCCIESEKQLDCNGLSDDNGVKMKNSHAMVSSALIVDRLPMHDSTFARIDGSTFHMVSEEVGNTLEDISGEIHHSNLDVINITDGARLSLSVAALDLQPVELQETDGAFSDTKKGEMYLCTAKADTCASHEDPYPCISEDSVLKLEIISQASDFKTATLDSQKHLLSEVPPQAPESLHDTVHHFSTHSLGQTLQNDHEADDEDLVDEHTFEMDNEAVHGASDDDLSVPHGHMSSNGPAFSSNSTHTQCVDAFKHSLHVTQNDHQALLASEIHPVYADSFVDKHGVENGAAAVLSNHPASMEEYKCCTLGIIKGSASVPSDRYSF